MSEPATPKSPAYESGFSVKWLIDAQINGVDSLNFDPGTGAVEAPSLSWAPYLWADGLNPRGDGLIWRCEDFVTTDGTHPSTGGRNIVADSLLAFFERDETTAPWFHGRKRPLISPAAREGLTVGLAVVLFMGGCAVPADGGRATRPTDGWNRLTDA